MRAGRLRGALVALAGAAALVGAGVVAAPAASADGSGHHQSAHLYVSTKGTDGPNCGRPSSPCRTIGAAVANASAGGEISVARGVYDESVTITKTLELEGHHATIDATGQINGIKISGHGADHSRVHGFTVQHAIGEGVAVTLADWVTIDHNKVIMNDQGGQGTPNTYPPCQPQGEVPGDCNEALHLDATAHARVDDNLVQHNVGGILIDDDSGPSHDNWITDNVSRDNMDDCGITMPSHNPMGTVFNNVIRDNVSANNGAAGILIAAAGPGMKAHDNVVDDNKVWGNGEGGVQLHAHAPGQSIDNNRITDNWIGTNTTAGDPDAGITQTTGVIVFSAVVPVNGTVIRGNVIAHNHFGIWLSPNVANGGITHNRFRDVVVPVQQ
ncbi:MAG TPA: NosD domain-containing protein [Acidimicrobiia bacterium]|jgi:nitrous oxidase accessory protein NosD